MFWNVHPTTNDETQLGGLLTKTIKRIQFQAVCDDRENHTCMHDEHPCVRGSKSADVNLKYKNILLALFYQERDVLSKDLRRIPISLAKRDVNKILRFPRIIFGSFTAIEHFLVCCNGFVWTLNPNIFS